MTTVLVFGAFDPLHPGHAYFLSSAAMLGDRLVVGLASDDAIRALKGHEPRMPFNDRKSVLKLLHPTVEVLASDASGSFGVINEVQPETIAIGYDQDTLRRVLEAWMATHRTIPIVTIESHEPEKYKSSLM